jgi:hypothetical protein
MARVHGNKSIMKFVREIEKIGFKMYPPAHLGTRVYTTHGTPQSIKPLCADFEKIYGVVLDAKNFL